MMVDVGFIYLPQHPVVGLGLPPMYAGMLLIPGTLAIIIAGLVIARGGALPPGAGGVFRSGAPRCRVRGARLPGCAQRLGIILIFIVLGTGIGIVQTISNDLMLSSAAA